jgi:hypothetical protein
MKQKIEDCVDDFYRHSIPMNTVARKIQERIDYLTVINSGVSTFQVSLRN